MGRFVNINKFTAIRSTALILIGDSRGHKQELQYPAHNTEVNPILGLLVSYFFQALANAVSSEGSFPVVDFIYPKLSNRLTPERVCTITLLPTFRQTG